MVRTNTNKDLDYFTIDRTRWLRLLAFERLAPLLVARGMPIEAAQDAARDAVEAGRVEVTADGSGALHRFDAEQFVHELEGRKPWLTTPQRAAEQPRGPARHPALGPNDIVPNSGPAWDRLPPLEKLKIGTRISEYDLAQAKAKREAATKKSA